MSTALLTLAAMAIPAVAARFIARSLATQVLGLRENLGGRAVEITRISRDMRLVLENVRQGLVMVDPCGRLAAEHSSMMERWFGSYDPGETLAAYLGRTSRSLGTRMALAWGSLSNGSLPLERCLDRLPSRVTIDGAHFRFEYQPLLSEAGELRQLLVVVSDVTSEVESATIAARRRETLVVLERILKDRSGFHAAYTGAKRLLGAALTANVGDAAGLRRDLRALKEQAGALGLDSVVRRCHAVEERVREGDDAGVAEGLRDLVEYWAALSETVDPLLDKAASDTVTMSGAEYDGILRRLIEGADRADIAKSLVDLKLETSRDGVAAA